MTERKRSGVISRRDFIKGVSVVGLTLLLESCEFSPSPENNRIIGDLVFDQPEVTNDFWSERGFALSQEGLTIKDIGSFTAKIKVGQLGRDANFVFYRGSGGGEFLVKNKDNKWESLLPTINAKQDVQLIDARADVDKRYPVFGWNAEGAKVGQAKPYFVANEYLFGDFLPQVDQNIAIPLLVVGSDRFEKMGGLVRPEVAPIKPKQKIIIYEAR